MRSYLFILKSGKYVAELRVEIRLEEDGVEKPWAEWFCVPASFFGIGHGTAYWNTHQLGLYDLDSSNATFPPPHSRRYGIIEIGETSDGLDDLPLQPPPTGVLNVNGAAGEWTLIKRLPK